MAITAPPNGGLGGKAPVTEAADDKAAKQGGDGPDRPGFDLGGAKDRGPDGPDAAAPAGSTTIPGGPKGDLPVGSDHGRPGAASGMSQGAGQSVGGPAGGSKPGEATQPTAGAVRPPQTAGSDQTVTQGNPDDAA